MEAGKEEHGPLYPCWLICRVSFIPLKQSCPLGLSLPLTPQPEPPSCLPTWSQPIAP